MKHTVVITAPLPEIATRLLSQECDVVTHDGASSRTEAELIDILSEADGAITMLSDPVTRRVLESNPNLRIVGNFAVGTNNIDLVAARDLGVVITNTPDVLTDATADLTLALILATTRRLIEGDAMVRRGEFEGFLPLLLLGTSLQGKRLGIIGMGRIGFAVAVRAHAFGMEVVYHARGTKPDAEEKGFRLLPLAELLHTSDVVSLHAPLTPETFHLIDEAAIESMKRGSYLINTARGALIDENALAGALQSGQLRGAGLDVYEDEPEVHPVLRALPQAVLLPHVGSATDEARNEMARLVASDVRSFLRKGTARHIVV